MRSSQELANVIKEIAKAKNVTIGKMLSDCGLGVNTLSSMQSGGYYPRLEAIAKIADYLDCSVDYLLGKTDVKKAAVPTEQPLTPDQQTIMDICSDLPNEDIKKVLDYIDFLKSKRNS